ncbi:MAG: hypothetical protein A2084_02905, partial [Tenericutes bacterium GWC2_39_45]
MCEVLEISPKTYYKYRYIPDKDYEDYKLIRKVFYASMKTYGYRRITDELRDRYGIIYNAKKVLRIMNRYGIQPLYIKNQQRNASKQRTEKFIKPDLLQRNFNQQGCVTDVTYLDYAGKRSFLSTMLDLQKRKIISYQISNRNDNKLVLDTLHKALKKIKDPSGLVLHSDQGFQYFSTEYQTVCESKGIRISMSRKGTPLDNAVIESFHSLLKKETLYNNDIKNHQEYIRLVKSWLVFYNSRRRKNKKVDFFLVSTFWGAVQISLFSLFVRIDVVFLIF